MAYTPIYTPKNFTDWGPPDLDASNLNDIEAALVSLGNGLQTVAADTDTNTADIQTLKTNPFVSGDLTVAGDVDAGTLNTHGNAEIMQDLRVDEDLTVAGDANITGDLTQGGNISAGGNVTASGDVEDGSGNVLSNKMDAVDIDEINVRSADALLINPPVLERVPYNFRKSGGKVGNVALLNDKIVGGSLAFNQKALDKSTATVSDVTITNNGDGTYTVNGTASAAVNFGLTGAISKVKNHVFIVTGCPAGGSATTYSLLLSYFDGGTWQNEYYDIGTGALQKRNYDTLYVSLLICNGVAVNDLKFAPQVIDLTRLFGQTIADYIYSLGTVDGIAYFKNLFDGIYAYNAGTLESVNTSKHIMRGFNQWDENWFLRDIDANTGAFISGNYVCSENKIRVIAGQTYYFKGSGAAKFYVYYYDENGDYIGHATGFNPDTTLTIPQGVCFILFLRGGAYGTTYLNDMCINISDASKNGTYEPYKETVYPLDESLTLRGVPMLDANNNLYYDGDEYTPDGTVKRNYKEINLGGINWTKIADWNGAPAFASDIMNEIRGIADNQIANILCVKYITFSCDALNAAPAENGICESTAKTIVIRDAALASGDAAAFKTAMQGVLLFVPLETPTTETAEPFTDPQTVNADGTEQYIDYAFTQGTRDVEIPVGHDSEYNRALELPALPSSDGAYNLKCTINNGVASYSWGA